MPESSVYDFLTEPDGLFRFTISYPAPDKFPDLRGKSTTIFGYYFAVESQTKTPDGENTLLTLRKRKIIGASGDWSVRESAGQWILPTKGPAPVNAMRLPADVYDGTVPPVDGAGPVGGNGGSGGGYQYPPDTDPTGGTSAGGSGTTAVIPVGGPLLIIGAVVAALAGLGVIYLIVDRVERIVESPAATVPLLAVGVAILAGVYAAFRKGKLG